MLGLAGETSRPYMSLVFPLRRIKAQGRLGNGGNGNSLLYHFHIYDFFFVSYLSLK